MSKSNVQSMTSGSPLRLILVFMIPLLLGNLFQQFYNIVDAMIVGRLLGADALVDGMALLQQPVGQGGLAVVDMGDDGKVADVG